jgi:hypothetical protein
VIERPPARGEKRDIVRHAHFTVRKRLGCDRQCRNEAEEGIGELRRLALLDADRIGGLECALVVIVFGGLAEKRIVRVDEDFGRPAGTPGDRVVSRRVCPGGGDGGEVAAVINLNRDALDSAPEPFVTGPRSSLR